MLLILPYLDLCVSDFDIFLSVGKLRLSAFHQCQNYANPERIIEVRGRFEFECQNLKKEGGGPFHQKQCKQR